LFFCGLVSFLYRDELAVRAYMGELMDLAAGQSIGAWPTLGRAMLGWVKLVDGRVDEGLTSMFDGVSSARKLGVSMFLPMFLCRIAEAMLDENRLPEAELYVDDAQALVSRTGEVNYVGELYRLKAELHCRKSEIGQANALYCKAIENARAQNAKSIELRVATSYSRFLANQRQGKRGLEMLESIYQWFQEGRSSRDFMAAQAAIASLRDTVGERVESASPPR